MSDEPKRIYIDATRPVEPNPKAIREAARDFAQHGARQQQEEAAAMGITRSELILRRIEQEKREDAQAHYLATLNRFAAGKATWEEVRAADPMRPTDADFKAVAERYAENRMRERQHAHRHTDRLLAVALLLYLGWLIWAIATLPGPS